MEDFCFSLMSGVELYSETQLIFNFILEVQPQLVFNLSLYFFFLVSEVSNMLGERQTKDLSFN